MSASFSWSGAHSLENGGAHLLEKTVAQHDKQTKQKAMSKAAKKKKVKKGKKGKKKEGRDANVLKLHAYFGSFLCYAVRERHIQVLQ